MHDIQEVEIVHRSIPLILIVAIVAVLSIILFVIGLMIGYGILHSPLEVFNPKTWLHLLKMTGSD